MTRLFLEILNMSISASYLVLAVLALRLLLKKAPKWVNLLLWGLVAVRLLCPISPESPLSLIPSGETVSPDILLSSTPAIQTGVPAINEALNPVIQEMFTPAPATSATPLQLLIPALSVVWLLGMAVMLLYTAVSWGFLKRRVSTAVRYRDNIFRSEYVASPFVLGVVAPRIYLPCQLDEEALPNVIAHEQAHIRRRDHWWKPLGFLLLTLHWFNPLMWLGYVLLCRDIELACDEKVIKALDSEQRAQYAQALVGCSVRRHRIAACPLAFGEVGVKERVKSVMKYKKATIWILVVSILVCAAAAVCFLTNPRQDAPRLGSAIYIGDAPKVVEVVQNLPYPEGCAYSSIQLQTAEEPYELTVFVNGEGGLEDFVYCAKDAFHKIENLGILTFRSADTEETMASYIRPRYVNMKFYLTIGAEDVTYLELTMPNSSGGCQNADGTPFKKGEEVWLEPLGGYTDVWGMEITARNQKGEAVWSGTVPEESVCVPVFQGDPSLSYHIAYSLPTQGGWRLSFREGY